MPSKPSPTVEIPVKDVKQASSSSREEEASTTFETPVAAAPTQGKDEEADVDEKDLEALEDQKKVPYNRFKEKNEEAKTLKAQLEAIKEQFEVEKRRAIEDAELRTQAKYSRSKEETEDLDPYEAKIRGTQNDVSSLKSDLQTMRSQLEHERLQSRLERLEAQYPKADKLAVLGWAKVKPGADLEELMESSHNRNVELVQKGLREIIAHKKQKAKAVFPTGEGGFRLKESERPKSIADANSKIRKFLGIS